MSYRFNTITIIITSSFSVETDKQQIFATNGTKITGYPYGKK